jgi:putative glutamine amidotransferase
MKKIWIIIGEYGILHHKLAAIIGMKYLFAVERLGALPVFLLHGTLHENVLIESCDAFIFTGGNDIDPRLYGGDMPLDFGGFPMIDLWTHALIEKILSTKKPILGICRGMQFLNVFFGWTLIPDLKNAHFHLDPARRDQVIDRAYILPDTTLSRIFWNTSVGINSIHHQAVDALWNGFQISATSEYDGTIEAIEHTTLPILCVQWHPEELEGHEKVFEWIV